MYIKFVNMEEYNFIINILMYTFMLYIIYYKYK